MLCSLSEPTVILLSSREPTVPKADYYHHISLISPHSLCSALSPLITIPFTYLLSSSSQGAHTGHTMPHTHIRLSMTNPPPKYFFLLFFGLCLDHIRDHHVQQEDAGSFGKPDGDPRALPAGQAARHHRCGEGQAAQGRRRRRAQRARQVHLCAAVGSGSYRHADLLPRLHHRLVRAALHLAERRRRDTEDEEETGRQSNLKEPLLFLFFLSSFLFFSFCFEEKRKKWKCIWCWGDEWSMKNEERKEKLPLFFFLVLSLKKQANKCNELFQKFWSCSSLQKSKKLRGKHTWCPT